MPTEMLTKDEHRVWDEPPRRPTGPDELRTAARRYAARVRRLKRSPAVWGVWTILITALWVVNQWQANGALEHFGHEGDPGQWNPTLWALGIGIPTLIVGIMALGVYFARPTADPASIPRQRLKFHVASWLFGMVVLTPLWALIEWQDNGSFERWSNNSRPGDWDPWILTVAGIWALAALALLVVRQLSGAVFGRSVTFTVGLPWREPGSRWREGWKMTEVRKEMELGRCEPLSIPGKYLSLTTYRPDGTPVSTPVWFVEEDGRLFVTTAADSYKAKRLRRNPAAMVAPCNARGVPKGDAIPVHVEFLSPDEGGRVDRLMAEKYRSTEC